MNFGKLLKECPSSLYVYCYLAQRMMDAGKGNKLFTTRAKIAIDLGIKSPKTVTKALRTLVVEKAISRKARTRVNAEGETRGKYYDISLRKGYLSTFCNLVFSLGKGYLNDPSVKVVPQRKGYLNDPSTTIVVKAEAGYARATPPSPKTALENKPENKPVEEVSRKYTWAELLGDPVPEIKASA